MPELWFTDIRRLSQEAKKRPLSSYRESRLAQMKHSGAREQGIAAERLLEQAMLRHEPELALPLDLVREEQGRPRLRSSVWQFSLSHSGDIAACALARHPIGLDVQKRSPFQERLALRCFTAAERRAFFPDGADDGAFTLLWALKESYLKLSGTGLHVPMSSFSVSLDENGAAFTADAAFWYAQEGDYCFALCVPRGCTPYPSVFSALSL